MIKELQAALPNPAEADNKTFILWWDTASKSWIETLRKTMIEHRNIGYEWDIDYEQLDEYMKATQLLAECLDSNCYVSREVRQEIEDTLFLPQVELDRYYAEHSDLNKDRR